MFSYDRTCRLESGRFIRCTNGTITMLHPFLIHVSFQPVENTVTTPYILCFQGYESPIHCDEHNKYYVYVFRAGSLSNPIILVEAKPISEIVGGYVSFGTRRYVNDKTMKKYCPRFPFLRKFKICCCSFQFILLSREKLLPTSSSSHDEARSAGENGPKCQNN